MNDLTKLNRKQEAFCQAYIGEAKFVATKAALIAGYSEKTSYSIGSENLKKPEIRVRINEMLADKGATPEHIISALQEIAFGDPANVVDMATGRVKDGANTMLVKSVSVGGKFGDKVELYDRLAAIEKLMAVLGMKSLGTVNVKKTTTDKNGNQTEETTKTPVQLIVLNGVSVNDL